MPDRPLEVELEQSGGFAGIRRRTTVNTAELSADEAARLSELVDQLDLEQLVRRQGGPAQHPDQFQYDLTVTRGGRQYRLRLNESDVPAEVRPLLDLLLRRARRIDT
jgi:hypothetical protein